MIREIALSQCNPSSSPDQTRKKLKVRACTALAHEAEKMQLFTHTKYMGKKQVNYHWQGHNIIFRNLIALPRLCKPLGMSLHSDIQFIYLQIKQEARVVLAV